MLRRCCYCFAVAAPAVAVGDGGGDYDDAGDDDEEEVGPKGREFVTMAMFHDDHDDGDDNCWGYVSGKGMEDQRG